MKRISILLLCLVLLCGCSTAKSVEQEEMPTESSILFDEKNITIDGMTNEYEVWFFADSHIIISDDEASDEVLNYAKERKELFTNDTQTDSSQILEQFIVKANQEKPDIILFGGDIIDFPSDANITFLQEQLSKLTVPYLFVTGNHDWTYPWEYMTEEGAAKYRPLLDGIINSSNQELEKDNSNNRKSVLSMLGNSYYGIVEFEDVVFLAVDDSANQVAAQAKEGIELAYSLEKPIILVQHVPFSTENLIAKAKENWGNPVTIGMQVHGGIAPNDISADLFLKAYDDDSQIKAVLAGHVHFAYEEQISDSTIEIITDAAFKKKAVKLFLKGENNKQHQYFCDKFMLTVDDKQINLLEVVPELSSVSQLLPITNNQLHILGRIDENSNALIIYDFKKEEIVFLREGTTMCWIQDDYDSVRYLMNNIVYDLEDNVIYQSEKDNTITMIEYVEKDFKVTVTEPESDTPQEVWVEK